MNLLYFRDSALAESYHLRRCSAYPQVEVTRLIAPYIRVRDAFSTSSFFLSSSQSVNMSKGAVHQIAAGGFGTGTNDLVRLFLLPRSCIQAQSLIMFSTTERDLHTLPKLFKLFTMLFLLPGHSLS